MVPTIDEEVLLVEAIAGDTQAFAQIYDRYFDRVFHHLYYRTGSHEDAEDLAQQVFLQAWRALGRYQVGRGSFVGWLLTIAHNAAVSFHRSNKPVQRLDFTVPDSRPATDLDRIVNLRFEQERVRQALFRLKPNQQQVIIMRLVDDMDYREMAAALEKSEATVRVSFYRALEQLRRQLDREQR